MFIKHCICTVFILTLIFVYSGCSVQSEKNMEKGCMLLSSDIKPELVIYSPHPKDTTSFIIREFRQRTGLSIRIISAGTGELLARLENEKDNPQCDIFWGGGVESLEAQKYLFEPCSSCWEEYIYPEYLSPDRLWTGFSVMPMVIIYNPMLVTPELVPDSWHKILNTYFAGRLLMADPARSGSSYSILMAILRTFSSEDEGWQYVNQLLQIVGKSGITSSSSEVYQLVASGERVAGLTFENAVLSLKNKGVSVELAYPQEGTLTVPDGIALVKNAKHRNAALQFMDFALSSDTQSIISSRWFRRSVRKDIAPPQGAPPYSALNLLSYNISESAARRYEVLGKWEAAKREVFSPY